VNGKPICFIVDARNLTLAERGMKRPTSMGLDISRSDFLSALGRIAIYLRGKYPAIVVFDH
jgi:hypothetical protein